MYSCEVLHAADVHQRGRQEAAHAEVEDEAALDDLDDRSLTFSPVSNFPSMRFQARSYSARFLDRIKRPSVSSFW